MFIEEIDRRYRETFPHDRDNWQDELSQTAILWDGQVRMANLSIICSHSVNGVSDLHTKILKDSVLHDFYELEPEKFNNKTNGISHRRFLAEANPPLAKLITDAIGDGWLDDASELSKLEKYEDDPPSSRTSQGQGLGQAAPRRLHQADDGHRARHQHGLRRAGQALPRLQAPAAQRLQDPRPLQPHARRPQLQAPPTAFIFSGKAAQSYTFAKEVIRLINSVADVVNNDARVNEYLKVAFVPNFAVSNAQLIYPAADISEQISWAGSEASGTSNMKLMMNGAITLGTYDGANVEICDLVGEENIKIFGLRTEEVDALRASGSYWAWDVYNADRDRLGRIIDMLTDGSLARLSGNFESIRDELMVNNDHDLVLKDFYSYVDAWEELTEFYGDRSAWAKAAIHNTARSGYFSSDRTIREYDADIWHSGDSSAAR